MQSQRQVPRWPARHRDLRRVRDLLYDGFHLGLPCLAREAHRLAKISRSYEEDVQSRSGEDFVQMSQRTDMLELNDAEYPFVDNRNEVGIDLPWP